MNRMLENIKRNLLYLVIILVAISYYPPLYSVEAIYSAMRLGLYAIVIFLVALTFSFKSLLKNGLLKAGGIVILLILLEFLIFYAFGLRFEFSDVWQLIIVLLCISIGFNLENIGENRVNQLLQLYAAIGVCVGLISFNFYKDAISELNVYAVEGKNQLGLIISSAAAVALYLGISLPKLSKQWIFRLFFLFGMVILLLMGARSAFAALLAFASVLLYKALTRKQRIWCGVILIIILACSFDFLFTMLIGNHDVTDLNSISTGRLERNMLGIAYINEYFWEGELYHASNIPWIHNYLILRLVRYGVWSFLFLFFYFYLFVGMVRNIIKTRRQVKLENIGFFLLIVPYFISLLEPSAPFGPGSNVFMLYIILGITMRAQYMSRYENTSLVQ